MAKTYRELIEREYRLRYDKPFEALKPELLVFIEECMRAVEVDGPFADKVREMREWQRQYFRSRTHEAINKSKAIERDIDLFLAPKRPRVEQGGLF